ncbi:MAG: hypothetical protein PHN88_15335 [Ignavibacteria bacterium]|nr:hypothetical protein [Ignavibacteria bacterium]
MPGYEQISKGLSGMEYEDAVDNLYDSLPVIWADEYKKQSARETNICFIQNGCFVFIFDDLDSPEGKGLFPADSNYDSRLIAAYGTSSQMKRKRDDYRLRGWAGKTENIFGKEWDKGHFIAHYLGGAVDGLELNVFKQRRDLNRGWSEEGKIYRKMEEFCFQNPDTFFFNRPIYTDNSANPAFLEFGIMKRDKELWVEYFNN